MDITCLYSITLELSTANIEFLFIPTSFFSINKNYQLIDKSYEKKTDRTKTHKSQ